MLNGSKKLSSRIPKISMDREAVEILSRRNPEISMDRESVKMLSRRQRAQENSLMDRESVDDLYRKRERRLDRRRIC